SIGLTRPSSIPALLERFWIALNVGDLGEVDQSRLLTLALSALWAAGLVFILLRWKKRVRTKTDLLLIVPATYVVLPLAATALVFNYTPFIPFTRLLLFSTPAYLVLMAWMLREVGRASRLGALAGAALALAIPAYALAGTYYVERHSADFEAVEVTRRLKSAGGADDAIIFQALWHAGYFRTHSGETSPSTLVLGEVPVSDLPRLLGRRNRLWLSMFASAKRDSNYPQEEWLDTNVYKAEEWWEGNLRLSLYGGRQDPPLDPINADFGGLVQLEAAGVAPGQARPGDVLRLFLRWRALREPGRKLVVFAHLVDADGRGCSSRDSEPVDGLRPTEAWKAGEVVDDRRGLVVRPGTPAGLYYLAVGLYAREDWRQRIAIQGKPEDWVLIGPIEVLPPSKRPYQFEPVAALPEAGLEIVEYELDLRRERRVIRNVDGPVDVWSEASLRPGSRAPIILRWRAGGPVGEAYRLVLEMVDSSGRAWGRSGDGPVGGTCPSFRWAPDEVVTETRNIAIQADAPSGKYRLRATIYPQQGDKPLGEPMVFGTLDLAGK
ncbi:MAG: hypothetical protein Q8O86_08435, partial [Dehalococcoidia bacterium]|nr:hypothetical protein [Dehalococcoidia bacterium]